MKHAFHSVLLAVALVFAAGAAGLAGRHTESAGGFSYRPPGGWAIKEVPGMKFRAAVGPTADGFSPNINIVDEATNSSLKEYVKKNLEALGQVFQDFKNLGQSEFKTDSGLKGYKLVTESVQQGKRMRQTFYFFDGRSGRKLVVTCSTTAETGVSHAGTFDQSVKSFEVAK